MLRDARALLLGCGTVLLVLAIGLVDLSTGPSYSFSIFYVLLTAAAGWSLGRGFGIVVGIVSGLSWDLSDSVFRAEDLAASMWNGLTRVAVFGTLAYLTATLRVLVGSLRRSQSELQELLVQREEFLSLMAHEVRAPVSAIEVVATGLLRSATLGERERRALQQLLGQARDLSTLAEGVLSASQLDAGLAQLEPETIDLAALATDIAEPHSRARLDLPADVITVVADRNSLRRAIANLVDNALKFSPEDQPVEIKIRRGGGGAFVHVIDHGIGLTAAEASRLFQKHSRIRHEATAGVEGVGLGLYLTRLIVEAHKGSVSVDSAGRGRGATFSLWVPHGGVRTAPTAPRQPA
ncbi:MAG: HAMP domain-containing histidine kinase [Chloroflexi bacterium]|nr:HAMP domain-containing histidine kinase [Chloroflexota bacterium]